MKKLYILLAFAFSVTCGKAQSFLNGDFEFNSAAGDQINLTHAAYNSLMANSVSFGTYGDIDIITSATYSGGPQSGNWFIAFTAGGTDMASMTLSAPLVAGNSYTISFYDKGASGYTGWPFQIGLSATPDSFGTSIYTSPAVPTIGVWTQRVFTFTAPGNWQYITVTMTGPPNLGDWAQVDNFSFTSTGTPLQAAATPVFATCFGVCNGSASVAASGGTPPYHYQWLNSTDTTSAIDSLCAGGSYYVTVTDSSGATVTDSVFLPVIDPFPVIITADTGIICSGSTANICAAAGLGNYLWNTGQVTNCISTSLAGNYYVTVTDNNGCSAESNHLAIHVYPQPPVSISVNGDTLTAYNAVTYQWYRNGSAINNATSNIYIAQQGGNYTVAVTDTNGCGAISTAVIILGIENLIEENAVSVYPNPLTDGGWQLTVGNNWLGSVAEVFDANGRVVYKLNIEYRISNIELNTASGVYLLRISSAKNSVVKKLIKM